LKVLALEPYHGGSHQRFLDGWLAHSRHDWTTLTLPPYKWKWRMRHSAMTFAAEVDRRLRVGESWDAVFCSDMLNLAEFKGLVGGQVAALPTVLYFHENQINYPVRVEKERDFQFGLSNIVSALAAERVWFNSRFHHDSFLESIPPFLNRMPDYRPLESVERIRGRSEICQPGVATVSARWPERSPGPLRILWAARWEFDKNPETFFEALMILRQAGVPFRVSVLGQSFREMPPVFQRAHRDLEGHVEVWGYQSQRADYQRALSRADVFVSTAIHEFFGIATVEAMVAGAYPLLPRRLAYPELLDLRPGSPMDVHFFDGSAIQLGRRLKDLAERLETSGEVWGQTRERCGELARRFCWREHASHLDERLEAAVGVSAGRLDRAESPSTL
jgi:glycosyltransferase involved in cell wall biosynthesis